jgi:hypothetical protein
MLQSSGYFAVTNTIICNMEQNKTKLPETVIVETERRAADDALRRALREAQNAYNALRELEDLGEIPEPHNCTTEWVEQKTTAKKQAVSNADFLTIAQKQSQIAHWGKFAKKVLGYVETIQKFIASIPSDQYVYDEEIGTFYVKDIGELVNNRCTRTVPVEAENHWRLIQKVRSAINELRTWEKDRDLKKYRLEDLFAMSPEVFGIDWATGNISIDHSYDHLPSLVLNRELSMKGYL